MSWIRCVILSLAIFSPAVVHSGARCFATIGDKFAEFAAGGVLLLASCAIGALFAVLLKHVTNTSVHLDPKNPVVTKEAHKLCIDGLGRSIDTVRKQGEKIEKAGIELSEQMDKQDSILDRLCGKLDMLLTLRKRSRTKTKRTRRRHKED